jgi:hypothetical protein
MISDKDLMFFTLVLFVDLTTKTSEVSQTSEVLFNLGVDVQATAWRTGFLHSAQLWP